MIANLLFEVPQGRGSIRDDDKFKGRPFRRLLLFR